MFGSTIIRLQTGQPVGSYYGYQVAGVFQNQADINGAPQQTNAAVGGFRFADLDGNGVIDARDKTFLGSPIPKYTYGFGFNLSVYDFDFAMDFQGFRVIRFIIITGNNVTETKTGIWISIKTDGKELGLPTLIQ